MKYTSSILILVCCLVGLFSQSVTAQTDDEIEELTDVSYIYSAVMGTGTYKVEDRRISMLSVPFAWTQREMTNHVAGVKWHLPVVVGYDALNYSDWIDRFLDDELVTLTVLPGIEVKQALTEYWVFKPFTHVGVGYDFTRNETILMGILGIRGLGTWAYKDDSELRLGMSYRYAAEYQLRSERFTGFSLAEAGVDYRRDTNFHVLSHETNVGTYYRAQLFLPRWRIDNFSEDGQTEIVWLHEIGVSVGLRRPWKKYGLSVSRVRTGFQFGHGVRGWTFGTEFPF